MERALTKITYEKYFEDCKKLWHVCVAFKWVYFKSDKINGDNVKFYNFLVLFVHKVCNITIVYLTPWVWDVITKSILKVFIVVVAIYA